MYLKILVISILLFVSQHIVKFLFLLDLNKHVWNHEPGPCRLVKGVEHGSEHIYVSPQGLAFITSGLEMPCASQNMKEINRKNKVRGKMFLFDFYHPEKDVVELKIVGENFNASEFSPHGIDGLVDSKAGRVLLYVVNHPPKHDTIEKFEFVSEKKELRHIRSFSDPVMRLMNDVALVEEDKFYFTKYSHYRDHLYYSLETMLQMPWSSVFYYNGKTYEEVTDGLLLANGLKLSLDKQLVYVASPSSRDIKIYKRESSNFLTLHDIIEMNTMPDNIIVLPETGHLLTGNHPVLYKIMKCLDDPSFSCPSQVTMLYMKNEGKAVEKIIELYSDDGETSESIQGSSVAAVYQKKMLIGTVQHKLKYCEITIPF